MFETNRKYRDSVFYDASSWSVANFYNMKYDKITRINSVNNSISSKTNIITLNKIEKSDYAYLISWDDYNAPTLLYKLLEKGINIKIALKPSTVLTNNNKVYFDRGSMLIPIAIQGLSSEKVYQIIKKTCEETKIQAYPVNSGYSIKGIDLGSINFTRIKKPKVMMLFEGGVSAYESGEVWHLFEQRLHMPITKVPERIFSRVDLQAYNVIILVSGSYSLLSDASKNNLKNWVTHGNTLITTKGGSSWAINNHIVNENFVEKVVDTTKTRIAYADARGTLGKQRIGGAIFKVSLDLTHPIAFGYHDKEIPMYKNNSIFIKPSKNRFSTVAMYTKNPHIDGFVTQKNIDNYITKSAAIIVSPIGKGRVVLFADNPNFRGAWYGTNKLFTNAIFFGDLIRIP